MPSRSQKPTQGPQTPSTAGGRWWTPAPLLVALDAGSFAVAYGLTLWTRPGTPGGAPPGMAWIPGGTFTIGSALKGVPRSETPAHEVRVDGFWMDETEVTNAQFAAFVEAAGHVTTAEKKPDLAAVRAQLLTGDTVPTEADLFPGSTVFTPGQAGRHRGLPQVVAPRPRESFLDCNDDQQVTGLRYDNWKFVFMEQRAPGTLRVWAEPSVTLRLPKLFNLRTAPYERADITSNTYDDWVMDHVFLFVPTQDDVGKFLMTFKEYPRRQKAASFNLDEVLQKLKEPPGGK